MAPRQGLGDDWQWIKEQSQACTWRPYHVCLVLSHHCSGWHRLRRTSWDARHQVSSQSKSPRNENEDTHLSIIRTPLFTASKASWRILRWCFDNERDGCFYAGPCLITAFFTPRKAGSTYLYSNSLWIIWTNQCGWRKWDEEIQRCKLQD